MNPPSVNTEYNLKKDIIHIMVLVLLCAAAYWPLSFHVFSLKNDALNYFLPVRWQISEAISQGYIPFWSPYFNLGYCLHGDMQSGFWNPVVWLFSIAGPYTLYTLQLETLLYVFLSGAGMYALLKYFNVNPTINLMCSASYMLSGFNIDSAQFLNWISSAAFLPFIILHYYRTLTEKKFSQAILTGFFLHLMFVSAYPAHVIVLLYLLLAMFAWRIISSRKEIFSSGQYKVILKTHGALLLCFTLLSLASILSYYTYLPLSERGAGADYTKAMSNPLHPLFLVSYLFPLPGFVAPFGAITDPLERNTYFGIIPLVFTVACFLTKISDPWMRFCKWALVISLLFSLGELGGIRVLAYYALPLMDSFRHPASAKVFTIFFACIIAALFFNNLQKNKTEIHHLQISLRIISLVSLLILAWCIASLMLFPGGTNIRDTQALHQGRSFGVAAKELLVQLDYFHILLINILIQVPFLLLLFKKIPAFSNWKQVCFLGMINSVLLCMLPMPFTVVKKDRATHIENVLKEHTVNGYPLPDIGETLLSNSKDGMKYFKEIGTLNMYNKKVGRVDYRITPCNLLSQNEFWFNPSLRDRIMQYPLLYKSDSSVLTSDSSFLRRLPQNKKYVLADRQSLVDSINQTDRRTKSEIIIKKFTPNNFEFTIINEKPAYHVLLQNHFPFWKASIDGNEVYPDKVDVAFMGIMLPAGKHKVQFKYEPTVIIAAMWISCASLVCLALYFLIKRKQRQ